MGNFYFVSKNKTCVNSSLDHVLLGGGGELEVKLKKNKYTMKIKNRFNGLDLINKMLEETWNEIQDIIKMEETSWNKPAKTKEGKIAVDLLKIFGKKMSERKGI